MSDSEVLIPVTEKVTLDEPIGIALLDLTPNQCRYPVGHSDVTLFCGTFRTDPKSSFCEHHHAIVWVKPRKIW